MDNTPVIESFDRIARHSVDSWDHNNHYHRYLMNRLPRKRELALDIGSGLGELSRSLSQHFTAVQGIDLSPGMVESAARRSAACRNITYVCGDFLSMDFEHDAYDCVVSVAALHHLPVREAIEKIKEILRPNGRLLILDLYRAKTVGDYFISAVAVLLNGPMKLVKRSKNSKALSSAWEEHERLDEYPTIEEIKKLCMEMLPNARVLRHLFWRYSIIWDKR